MKRTPTTLYPIHDLYDEYKRNYVDLTFSKRFSDVTKRITLEHLNLAINCCEKWESFIDIGASTGHYASALVNKFKQGLLVEATPPQELELLTKKFPNLSHKDIYIENLKTDKKFDFAMLVDVFEHIADVDTFVANLTRLQECGGVVFILTPNALSCGPAPESQIYYTRHKDGHRKHYLVPEVTRVMEKHRYWLVYEMYEGRSFREHVQRILNGLARRDTRWAHHAGYRSLMMILQYPIGWMMKIIESIVYYSEQRAGPDLETRTVGLVYKKK